MRCLLWWRMILSQEDTQKKCTSNTLVWIAVNTSTVNVLLHHGTNCRKGNNVHTFFFFNFFITFDACFVKPYTPPFQNTFNFCSSSTIKEMTVK